MKLPNKYYDILKWIVLIVMPASAVLVEHLGNILGWQYTDMTVQIVNAFTVFLGVTLGLSNINYKNGGEE
ncbi:holin [Enterococcus florum]|uniref:Holin n=1 Tax=Enterococcus florum TaxID=2480627 RepID=A0A4P5P419_9ENTE|nr:phage holin [Enterococcus florum]GCF92517.1 holin [Enterococcus florum]